MLKTIFIFEWKKVSKSRFFLAGILAILLISAFATYNGQHIIAGQKRHIHLALKREDSIFNDIVKRIEHPDTATAAAKWAYGHLNDAGWTITSPNKRWTAYWEPSAVSYLSIGNRDVYPYYHELEPYSFYMRFFKSEISSPLKMLYGNFDLSFVITLLFPLLFISFTFDLFSAEKENGTLSLLRVTSSSTQVLFCRMVFYLMIILLVLNLVMLAALLSSGQVPGATMRQYMITGNLYLLAWFVIIGLVLLLKKASIVNAVVLAGIWILFTIALPAVFNAIAEARYPVNAEAFSKYIRRVQMSDDPKVKKQLLAEFYGLYPEYAHTDTTNYHYMNKLYTAYGNLNDRKADPLLTEYFGQLQDREKFLLACNALNPVTQCQYRFNEIAGTNLRDYVGYVVQCRRYVQALKDDLTKKVFNETPLTVGELKHRLSFKEFINIEND